MALRRTTLTPFAIACLALLVHVGGAQSAAAQFLPSPPIRLPSPPKGGVLGKVSKGVGSATNQVKRGVGSATNQVKRGAGNVSGTVRRAGGSIARETQRGMSSAGRNLSNQRKSLGKVYVNGRNSLGTLPSRGNQTFNNLGGNLRPPTPSFPPANQFRNSLQNGATQFRNQASNSMRNTRSGVQNSIRNPVQRVQDNANRTSAFARQQADRIRRGEHGSSSGAGGFLSGTVDNLSKSAGRASNGLVTITKQATSSVNQGLKDTEKQVRRAGGVFAEESKNAARNGSKSATAITRSTVRTTEDVFSGGAQILGGGLESTADVITEAGRNAEGTLANGGKVLMQSAEDGAELYQQGKQKFAEGKALYEEGKERYEQARSAYDKLKNGDREDALSVFEDVSGVEVGGQLRETLLETDLVDAVELAEDVTGIDMENAKQRVAQGQVLVDAARTGKLSNVEEAAGAKSNRSDVRAEKADGWDNVAWGNEIDHDEYVKMAGAIGASGAVGNSGPFMVYAEQWAAEQYATLSESLYKQGKDQLASKLNKQMFVDALQNAVDGKPATLPIKGVTIDVGMATYNHSLEMSADLPEITSSGIELSRQGATTKLPNTHQPYVRFKFDE